MKRRLARWLLGRAERSRWAPRRALCWAFDYTLAHGKPAVFGVHANHPLIQVNPQPRTWASGNSTVITFPLSPDNPYR